MVAPNGGFESNTYLVASAATSAIGLLSKSIWSRNCRSWTQRRHKEGTLDNGGVAFVEKIQSPTGRRKCYERSLFTLCAVGSYARCLPAGPSGSAGCSGSKQRSPSRSDQSL